MTRMWGVPPELMCNQHLLGEHVELHMMIGQLEKGNTGVLKGHAKHKQVIIEEIPRRHDEIVEELINKRDYAHQNGKHQSPINFEPQIEGGEINLEKNLRALARRTERCKNKPGKTCRERIRESEYGYVFTSGKDFVDVRCDECGIVGKMQRHNAGHLIKSHRHEAYVDTKL